MTASITYIFSSIQRTAPTNNPHHSGQISAWIGADIFVASGSGTCPIPIFFGETRQPLPKSCHDCCTFVGVTSAFLCLYTRLCLELNPRCTLRFVVGLTFINETSHGAVDPSAAHHHAPAHAICCFSNHEHLSPVVTAAKPAAVPL